MTFRTKTILGILAIEAVLLAVLIWTALSYLRSSTEDEIAKRADTTAGLVATMTKDAVISTDLARLQSFLAEVMKIPGVIYVRVHGRNGILAEAGDRKALQKTFAQDTAFEDIDDGVFDAAVEITEAGHVFGRVEAGIDIIQFSKTYNGAKQSVFSIALLVMALSALFSWLLGSILVRQLKGLKNASERISKGELGFKIEVSARDEIGNVAESFNLMSDALKENNSERVKAEIGLLREKEFVDKAINAQMDTFFVFDPKTAKAVRWNNTFREVTGYTDEEIAGMKAPDSYYSPEDLLKARAGVDEILKKGQTAIEMNLICKDGRRVPAEYVGSAIMDDENNLKYIVAVGRDITERKKAEEELQKLASAVRYSQELVNLATLDGMMIFLNEAGGRMLGIAPDEVAQTHIMQVIPEHLKGMVEKEVLPSLMEGGTWSGDLRYVNLQTGRLVDVYAMTYTIKDQMSGKPIYFANVSSDITERKHAEQEKEKRKRQINPIYQ